MGISPDPVDSHRKFSDKYDLKVTLLSDPDKKAMTAYGSWGIKKLYGKEVTGTTRSTFIIDPKGKIASLWKSVKASGHAEKVRERLVELNESRNLV